MTDATPKPSTGSRARYPRPLPAELRRSRGKKIAAHDPAFWGFGPPPKGQGPKPIRYQRPSSEAVDEPPTGEAAGEPEAHY